MSLGYGMYNTDNHLYEPADAFTRHLRNGGAGTSTG